MLSKTSHSRPDLDIKTSGVTAHTLSSGPQQTQLHKGPAGFPVAGALLGFLYRACVLNFLQAPELEAV